MVAAAAWWAWYRSGQSERPYPIPGEVERITARSQSRLRELAAKLTGWERLCIQLAPQRTLERGFSITRDSQGRTLADPAQVAPGERIISQLAGGRLTSRVEES